MSIFFICSRPPACAAGRCRWSRSGPGSRPLGRTRRGPSRPRSRRSPRAAVWRPAQRRGAGGPEPPVDVVPGVVEQQPRPLLDQLGWSPPTGTLPPIAMIPASMTVACGRYCWRTAELAPSAATSTSPVTLLPSAKWAVTVSSECSWYLVKLFAVDRVAVTAQRDGGGELELLGEHVEVAGRAGAGGDEGGKQLRRQALLQGAVAGGKPGPPGPRGRGSPRRARDPNLRRTSRARRTGARLAGRIRAFHHLHTGHQALADQLPGQASDQVDGGCQDHRAEQVGQQRMAQRGDADVSCGQLGVRDLEGHADRESHVGKSA